MISQEIAAKMLQIPKKVYEKDTHLDSYDVKYGNVMRFRIPMASLPNFEYKFFLEVKQSERNRLKITLHFQDHKASPNLLRIDYGGIHVNPEIANEYVTEQFLKYKAKEFSKNEPHIHYYIQGHDLDWALPLLDDDFPIKTITCEEDKIAAVMAMCKKVNLQTMLEFQEQMELIV